MVVVDTTRVKRLGIGQHGRKTDRIDAEVLARALERGGIPIDAQLGPVDEKLAELCAFVSVVDEAGRFRHGGHERVQKDRAKQITPEKTSWGGAGEVPKSGVTLAA